MEWPQQDVRKVHCFGCGVLNAREDKAERARRKVFHGARVSQYRVLSTRTAADICRRVLDTLLVGNPALRPVNYGAGSPTCATAIHLGRVAGSSTSGERSQCFTRNITSI